MRKIPGDLNVADLGTKHLNEAGMTDLLRQRDVEFADGRSKLALQTTG